MALQTLEGSGVWVPSWIPRDITDSTYAIDATGEKVALIFACPKDGSLDRFDADIETVTNSPDNGLRFSFQGVSATDGQPDGTILGATNNAFVTYAHTVTAGWKSDAFGESATVTRGQLVAAVIDIPTFTASDSVSVSSTVVGLANSFPYAISALTTKSIDLPAIAIHYTDGYAFIASTAPGVSSIATVSFQVGSATDEWGLAFQLPFPAKLNKVGVVMSVAAGANFELVVYDSGDTALATYTHDGDIVRTTSVSAYEFFTEDELTLTENSTYRVTIRPTTANSVGLRYFVFNSAEVMQTVAGGDNFYLTSRVNQAGSWTNYNNSTDGFRAPRIALSLSALDDGAGSGGGVTPLGNGLHPIGQGVGA